MTDLIQGWHWSTATCLAAWEPEVNDLRVVVSHGGFLHDPYVAMAGPFPGITADDNEQLARNLLAWLSRSGSVTTQAAVGEAFRYFDRIERLLAEYCRSTMSKSVPDWFATLPDRRRERCIDRSKADGGILPPEAYLDLVDYQALIAAHWVYFESDFHRVGWLRGKTKATHWIKQLNNVRKVVCHPSRRQFSGTGVSQEDLDWLKETEGRIRVLALSG